MTLPKACKNRLNKNQDKLIKCIVGLSPNNRTTPLFNALNVHPHRRVQKGGGQGVLTPPFPGPPFHL